MSYGLPELRYIEGFEDKFAVTRDGRIWSCPRTYIDKWGNTRHVLGSWRKTYPNRYGYVVVPLEHFPHQVHRLVAKAYLPNPDSLDTVNHKDGDKLNNDVSNLEWLSRGDNTRHSFAAGLQTVQRGGEGAWSKLTKRDVLAIRRLLVTHSQRAVAKRFGVSQAAIAAIATRRSWSHV